MRQKVVNVAAFASGGWCLLVCALWVRSYVVTDQWFWQAWEDAPDRTFWRQDTVRSGRGGVGMIHIVQSGPRPGYRERTESWVARLLPPFHQTGPAEYPAFNFGVGDKPVWGGFKRGAYAHPVAGQPGLIDYGWQVVVPYWAAGAALALLPVVWGVRQVRRRRTPPGFCPSCGYDLRATPGRCPECGAIPAEANEPTEVSP